MAAKDADRSLTAYARRAWEPWIRVKEAGASTLPNEGGEDWLLVAVDIPRLPDAETMAKAAYSPTLQGMGEIAGYLPGGNLSWSLPGVPKHLQGMLAGGLLGAGVGYGLGYMGEQVLPESWQRGRLRKTLGVLGGLAGAAPGAFMAASNLNAGRGVTDDVLSTAYPDDPMSYTPSRPDGAPNELYKPDMPFVPRHTDLQTTSKFSSAAAKLMGDVPPVIKEAVSQTGYERSGRRWTCQLFN